MYSTEQLTEMFETHTFPQDFINLMYDTYITYGCMVRVDANSKLLEPAGVREIPLIWPKRRLIEPLDILDLPTGVVKTQPKIKFNSIFTQTEENLPHALITCMQNKIALMLKLYEPQHKNDEIKTAQYMLACLIIEGIKLHRIFKIGLNTTIETLITTITDPSKYDLKLTFELTKLQRETISTYKESYINTYAKKMHLDDTILRNENSKLSNIYLGNHEATVLIRYLDDLKFSLQQLELPRFSRKRIKSSFDVHDSQRVETLYKEIKKYILDSASSKAPLYVLNRPNIIQHIKTLQLEKTIEELTPESLKNVLSTAHMLGLSPEGTKDYIRNTQGMSISTDDLVTIEF